jgi:hypothetical protein
MVTIVETQSQHQTQIACKEETRTKMKELKKLNRAMTMIKVKRRRRRT